MSLLLAPARRRVYWPARRAAGRVRVRFLGPSRRPVSVGYVGDPSLPPVRLQPGDRLLLTATDGRRIEAVAAEEIDLGPGVMLRFEGWARLRVRRDRSTDLTAGGDGGGLGAPAEGPARSQEADLGGGVLPGVAQIERELVDVLESAWHDVPGPLADRIEELVRLLRDEGYHLERRS